MLVQYWWVGVGTLIVEEVESMKAGYYWAMAVVGHCSKMSGTEVPDD